MEKIFREPVSVSNTGKIIPQNRAYQSKKRTFSFAENVCLLHLQNKEAYFTYICTYMHHYHQLRTKRAELFNRGRQLCVYTLSKSKKEMKLRIRSFGRPLEILQLKSIQCLVLCRLSGCLSLSNLNKARQRDRKNVRAAEVVIGIRKNVRRKKYKKKIENMSWRGVPSTPFLLQSISARNKFYTARY